MFFGAVDMLAERIGGERSQGELIAPKSAEREKIIVIGSGPVGMRFVDEVLKLKPSAKIHVFGNEPFAPYNRVQLSALLAGQVKRDDIDIPLPRPSQHPGFKLSVATIATIDRQGKVVVDTFGKEYPYDKLIFATGARAHIPTIPGIDKKGVYPFRRLADAEALFARVTRSRHIAVLGGGLLGIEAAKALARSGTKVTLIQQGEFLMNRQLDETSSGLLRADVEGAGIDVITHSGAREILGDASVSSVKVHSGEEIECDTVVVCAGIQANKKLALAAKLPVGRGIKVDDQMRTNDENIFAVGECSEHRGKLYGFAQPGFEQASVAARVVCDSFAVYSGSQAVSRLKVIGRAVCSMGEIEINEKEPFIKQLRFQRKGQGLYRKLILRKGKLVGGLGYGEWEESSRVQRALQSEDYIWPWQRALFKINGKLWIGDDSANVQQWPEKTMVCHCKQVTKGEILDLKETTANCTLKEVQQQCGASTVCGTCKPLVAELVEPNAQPEKEIAWSTLMLGSLIALVVAALIIFMPEAKVSDSVLTQSWFEGIWNDKFWKQVTGFTLLGLTVVGLLMSLRKRFSFEWMGKFAYWRAVHTVLGTLCVALLILHTGFHLGANLNQWLMINFLLLIGVGSVAGMAISMSHRLKPSMARQFRKLWTWLHIIVAWPLPALLAAHVLSVYYF